MIEPARSSKPFPRVKPNSEDTMASVRYIVSDVSKCVGFYRDRLGFTVNMQAEGFAALSRGDLRLFLNVPGAGSAGKAGGHPEPADGTGSRSRPTTWTQC